MNFVQSIKTCFKKYVTVSGRASRSEFWYFVLFVIIISIVASVVDGISTGQKFGLLYTLVIVLTLVPRICVAIRRLHDVDRSGWWILIALTIVGLIPLIYWYCKPGTAGANKFGEIAQ